MSGVPGKGLAQGLSVTLRAMTQRSTTNQYPDVAPELPPRSRGVIALLEENCTVCMLCARECPDWCIYIDSHKEVVPPKTEGARERTRNVLDRFAIDFSLCMYCGICIEACPFDALFWSPEFEYAELDIRDLTHEKDRLAQWMWTVPPPPAHDERAEEPKEIAAAGKSARPAAARGEGGERAPRGDRPVRTDRPQRPPRTETADRPERRPRGEDTDPQQRPPRAERAERAERPPRAEPAEQPPGAERAEEVADFVPREPTDRQESADRPEPADRSESAAASGLADRPEPADRPEKRPLGAVVAPLRPQQPDGTEPPTRRAQSAQARGSSGRDQ